MTNNLFFIIANVFLGLLLISYNFYRRVLLIRLPKDLMFLTEITVNYNILLFVVISLIICFIGILYNILRLINYIPKETFLNKLGFRISNIIDNALNTIFALTANMTPDFYMKSSYFCQKFYKYFKNKSECTFLFILYIIRLIILIAFLIDVFFFLKLNYMYKCLFLLCISLLIRIMFYIIKDFTSNLNEAKEVLIIKDNGIDSKTNLPITIYKLKPEYQELNLDFCIAQFILLNKLTGYLENYNKYSDFFTPRINIIIYSLYSIGWLYVLYVNIKNGYLIV